MLRKRQLIVSIIIYFLFLIVASILPLFSYKGYSIISNTTSHLGAQGSPYAIIMNVVFILLGINAIYITFTTRIPYIMIFGSIFGLSLVMTGIFQHAPMVEGVNANNFLDIMHSIFATATGFSFTLLAVGHGIMSRKEQRIIALIMAVAATVIPISMMLFPLTMGVLQRVMFLISFGWLFFYFKATIRV